MIPSSLAEAVETYSKAIEDGLSIPDKEPDPIKGVTPPDPPVMSRSVIAKVSQATLRVEGRACSLIQDGSGVVIARDLVVTNAHVVAGEKGSTTVSNGAIRRSADVVAFDPRRDIAILRIKNLGISPLMVSSPITNATVALFGYPGGRELRVEGGRILDQIEATGADLYGNGEWSRKILILAADLEPGDSGGPVVSRSGLLLGLSFATDPRLPHTSYALDPSEIRTVLNTVRIRTVDTGKCLAK
jgi:S1-C subfamily serine protease